MFGQKFELPADRKVANIDKSVFKKITGEYELQPGFTLTITSNEGKLFAQGPGQPNFEIFPESEYKYFPKVVDAQVEFIKDEKGNTTSLILYQGGAKMPAKKIK
jgi:hypothetical protein